MLFFAGFNGIIIPPIIVTAIWLNRYRTRKKVPIYDLEPRGKAGAFEPLLQKYLHLAEFIIGLATGSIVLLVGSSVLHGKDGRSPWFYASPLLVLAASVLTGILFMVSLILSYEDVQHGNPHTAGAYAFIETLGFSSLLLFVIGYVWLILQLHVEAQESLGDNTGMVVMLSAVRREDGMLDYSKDGPGAFKNVLPWVFERVEAQLRANNASQDEAEKFIEQLNLRGAAALRFRRDAASSSFLRVSIRAFRRC
jgi:hypothetical protein